MQRPLKKRRCDAKSAAERWGARESQVAPKERERELPGAGYTLQVRVQRLGRRKSRSAFKGVLLVLGFPCTNGRRGRKQEADQSGCLSPPPVPNFAV